MRKNFLAVFAIAIAVAMSAFTFKPVQNGTYFEYDGSSATNQKVFGDWDPLAQQPVECPQSGEICFLLVTNVDGIPGIQEADFLAAFEAVDGSTGSDDDNLLDEAESLIYQEFDPED